MKSRRVCVTGIGIVSPLGNNTEATWQNVIEGKSGADKISQFQADTWPTTFACEVRGFELPAAAVFNEHRPYLNRPSEFGVAAALEAMASSGIEGSVNPRRFGYTGWSFERALAGARSSINHSYSLRFKWAIAWAGILADSARRCGCSIGRWRRLAIRRIAASRVLPNWGIEQT